MKQDEGYTSAKHDRSEQIADKYRKKAAERSGETAPRNVAARLNNRSGSRSSGSRRRGSSRRSGIETLSFRDVLAGLLDDRRFLLISLMAAVLLMIFIFSRIFAGSGGRKPVETTPVETSTEEETEEPTTEEAGFVLGSYAESGQPALALTFDNGPVEGTTDAILDILEQYGAHATFFMIGENVSAYPAPVKRMAELGCELGNHTWNNRRLTTMSAVEREADFLKTNQTIRDASGGTQVTVIRPPYGATDKEIRDELNIPIIIWSLDTLDWETKDTLSTIQNVRDGLRQYGGDIVLMHDIHQSTVDAVKELVPSLIEKGYRLLTVSELYEYYGEELTLHLGHAYAEPQEWPTEAPAAEAGAAGAETEASGG